MTANIVVVSSAVLPQVQSVNGQTGVISLNLTGDVTSPAGSFVTTLATVNSNVGSFGDASHTVTLTLDAKGRATAATANSIAIAASQVTSGTFAAGLMPAFTGDATSSAGATALTLATVNANVGTFGSTTQIPAITVNAKGLITAASNQSLSLVSPPPIGSTTANTGAFTTLSASSTVSGAGFSTYLASPPAIGGTAANAGTFTTLFASGAVQGAGFTALFAAPPALGSTTPNSVAATTISATGAITPSQTAGLVGTTTNNNAIAGAWGEYQTATTSGTALTTGTSVNVASISLTAGDWDVQGLLQVVPAGTTVVSSENVSISTTSNTLGATLGSLTSINFTHAAGQADIFATPTVRLSLSATTTVYCVANVGFTTSTCTANGLIRARRVR